MAPPSTRFRNSRSRYVAAVVLLAIVLCGVIAFLIFRKTTPDLKCNVCDKKNISPLGEECSSSSLGAYNNFAISTDSNVCAQTGRDIIEKENGNAVDAAIAVQLCMGVTIPESLGLGGGSLITIYNAATKKSVFVDARESAPEKAHLNMFNSTDKPKNWTHYGIEAIGVPGELRGHHHIFTKYGSGRVTWKRLFEAAIDFAQNGFPVGEHLATALEQKKDNILYIKELRDVYTNPQTQQLYKVGEILKQPRLAETLRRLSESGDPGVTFYNDIAKEIMKDIQNIAPQFPNQTLFLSERDFSNYRVNEYQDYSFPLKINDKSFTLHTSKLPGSGILLQFILRLMAKYDDLYPEAYTNPSKAALFYHRLMEAFKFAFANRQYLGDEKYDDVKEYVDRLNSDDYINSVFKKIIDDRTFDANDEEHYDKRMSQKMDSGTAHLSVLDREGNAVAITATVNLYFGSKVLSPSTGILLNNEMDDFNTGVTNDFGIPPSHANGIAPNKRPLSSMVPSIFTDDTGVRLVIGASGGPKIITAVAYASLRHLFFKENIKQSIDAARPHHQLHPDQVVYEACFPKDMVSSLEGRKHSTLQLAPGVRGAIVMGISRSRDGVIHANSDFRKGGTIAGI